MSIRITNFGLDACASAQAGLSAPYFMSWHLYSAIGTGSTAPSQTDTALVTEVMRSNSNGGFANTESSTRDTVANKLKYTVTTYRVFNITVSYNLTEFGHFTSSSGANCVYRDLFRQNPNDPNSTPVVLSVQNGDQLQLIRSLTITCDWITTSKSFVITGSAGNDTGGTHTGDATAFATSDPLAVDALKALWPGGVSGSDHSYLHTLTGTPSSDRATAVASNGTGGVALALTADTYTSGSYQRTKRATLSTSQGNYAQPGWAIARDTGPSASVAYGYKFVLTNPTSFTKDSLHTLTLVFKMTWARG